ncbi:DMSO/selenate family reductase complex B subunit [Enterobacter hormaechei]|nr:DMSO/selenate family reductase complex B subunit [Enterobacter hormaechei]MED5725525.1 DMSO/selenate family reductase complex B subunit [Enterobacter hormaechei]
MTTQYGFFIDSSRCTGCKTCELACKDYKDLTPDVSFRRIYEYAGGDWQEDNGVWHQDVFAYYLSIACNHCEDPACTKVCPSGAMHKRDDGFVVVDEDVCIGCRYCHMACPYGAPQYNAAKGHMTKCDGCHSRVADGKKPICVESCLLPAVSLLALVISTVVALMQGAELATIHSSIQQASALVPDYGSLMAWRVVLLTAALVCWIAPQLKGYSPALPLLSLAFVLVLAGELIGRGVFYGLHMTVGMAIAS